MSLFVLLFWRVERFCHDQTRGFQVHKILGDLEPSTTTPILSEKEQTELKRYLSQPFYFLGRGGQCYAFISEDQTLVLKLFKNHHIRFWNMLNQLSIPSVFEAYRQKLLSQKLHQSPAFFQSCELSYSELKEQTGLIYLHLNRTEQFNKKLTLIDNLGIAHPIDLDLTLFALQKKAERSSHKLKALIRQNDLSTAKRCLDSLLDLIVLRCQKGIGDRDPNFRRNVGFVGIDAIELDIGSYFQNESLKQPGEFKREVLAQTEKLQSWLQKRSPELALYLHERTEERLLNLAPY